MWWRKCYNPWMTRMSRRRYLGISAAALFGRGAGAYAAGVDDPAVEHFMEEFRVPGFSFAIAKGGKVVRRQAYGFADLKKRERLDVAHRFRIASVSKPITSAAIFKLVERAGLELDAPIFGDGGLLALDGPEGISVRHLLTHTSGGWKNDMRDPMFKHPEFGHEELIRWTLEKMPPANPPGIAYAYSNFGYCLLGRVIEKISGQPYEVFVRENVLAPCGADGMGVGKAEREVGYYMDGKPLSTKMNVARMDSHGGWVGTPGEMLAFALRVDGFAEPIDLLEAGSRETMVERRGVNEDYACGWSVNKVGNYWHSGSLPGLTSLLVRTAEGFCWAACANTRTAGIDGALDRLMWELARTG